jgi:hypothetical protein
VGVRRCGCAGRAEKVGVAMKWFIFLFLLWIFLPLGAQLRTRYTPLPALQRVRRKVWAVQGQRWGMAVAIVRVEA